MSDCKVFCSVNIEKMICKHKCIEKKLHRETIIVSQPTNRIKKCVVYLNFWERNNIFFYYLGYFSLEAAENKMADLY